MKSRCKRDSPVFFEESLSSDSINVDEDQTKRKRPVSKYLHFNFQKEDTNIKKKDRKDFKEVNHIFPGSLLFCFALI